MDPSKEWTDRVAAMTRLEALLLGGAAEWDCFPGLLGKLRGPLTAQVADRRSSIVRQAAHLLVVLAAELGGEFEKEAAHYVPELFKCVVITVQIIAESGDLGVRGILHNCQARALVPRLCDAASKDRSVKLRCQATGWLRLVVREWDDACLGDRGRDCVEEAILSMVKDGSNDVRAGARRVFADYARRYPDHAGARAVATGRQHQEAHRAGERGGGVRRRRRRRLGARRGDDARANQAAHEPGGFEARGGGFEVRVEARRGEGAGVEARALVRARLAGGPTGRERRRLWRPRGSIERRVVDARSIRFATRVVEGRRSPGERRDGRSRGEQERARKQGRRARRRRRSSRRLDRRRQAGRRRARRRPRRRGSKTRRENLDRKIEARFAVRVQPPRAGPRRVRRLPRTPRA